MSNNENNEEKTKSKFHLFYLKTIAFRFSYKNSSNYLFNLLFDKHFRPEIFTHIINTKISSKSSNKDLDTINDRNLEFVDISRIKKLLMNEDLNNMSRLELEYIKYHINILQNHVYLSIFGVLLFLLNGIGSLVLKSKFKKKRMYELTMGIILILIFPFNMMVYVKAFRDYENKSLLEESNKNCVLKYKYFFEN